MKAPAPPKPTEGFRTQLDCIACLMRQAREAVALATRNPRLREATFRQALQLLACVNWQLSPPALGRQLHRLIRDMTHNPDPYAAVKAEHNRRAARLEPVWHRRFAKVYSPFEAAVRLALAGNLLDVGAKTQLSNYESLFAVDRPMFFLLNVKCSVVSEALRCPIGSLVVHRQLGLRRNPSGVGPRDRDRGGSPCLSQPNREEEAVATAL